MTQIVKGLEKKVVVFYVSCVVMTVNVKIVIMQYLWCYVLGLLLFFFFFFFFFLGGGGGGGKIGCYWIFIKATSVLLPQVQAVWPLDCLTGGHCDPHLKFLSGALKPVVRQENLHYVGIEQRMHETLMTSKYSPTPLFTVFPSHK